MGHDYLHGDLSLPAVVLGLVVDIVGVEDGVPDPGHEGVDGAAALVRPGHVIQRLRKVQEDDVDPGQDHRRLWGGRPGQLSSRC